MTTLGERTKQIEGKMMDIKTRNNIIRDAAFGMVHKLEVGTVAYRAAYAHWLRTMRRFVVRRV